jgi:hypothetical protein
VWGGGWKELGLVSNYNSRGEARTLASASRPPSNNKIIKLMRDKCARRVGSFSPLMFNYTVKLAIYQQVRRAPRPIP